MRPTALVLLLACPAPRGAAARSAEGAAPENSVEGTVWLNKTSFKNFIRSHDKVLVNFHDRADLKWRLVQAEYSEAAALVRKTTGGTVMLASVDASKEPELVKAFAPEHKFPRFVWFAHGKTTRYHRTLKTRQGIATFVQDLDRDPIYRLSNEAEVKDIANRVVFAQVPKASPMYRALEIVGSRYLDLVLFTHLESDKGRVAWAANETAPATYEGEATVEGLEKWLRGLLTRSEPVPEDPLLGSDVLTVVGKTFEEFVMRPDKDVFLNVYAPWCGHCRKAMPVWEDFARQVKAGLLPDLVVAKMNGDANGSPFPEDFTWSAYPTYLLFRAGSRRPLIFTDKCTVDNLAGYVRSERREPVDDLMLLEL